MIGIICAIGVGLLISGLLIFSAKPVPDDFDENSYH